MKLGISYNVFSDSIELLKASIENLREVVDKVVVVTQKVSNFKEPCDPILIPYLEHLKDLKLIDEIILFEPNNFGHQFCHKNETEKRNIGKNALYNLGCTHFLSMDSDEFYNKDSFNNAKKIVEENLYDTTYVKIQDYHVKPIYQIDNLANYYVPFIQSIFMNHQLGTVYPKYCDPTRVVQTWRTHAEIDCTMHHMTTVRIDLYNKYRNSSANINFSNIEATVNNLLNYVPESNDPKVNIVEDVFKVNDSIIYFKTFKEMFDKGC
jgi:hypothetical protein